MASPNHTLSPPEIHSQSNIHNDHVDVQERSKRLYFICVIGIIDILLGIIYINSTVQSINNHHSGFGLSILECMTTLLRITMGVGFIRGSIKKEDSRILWCCSFWIACQLIFLSVTISRILCNILPINGEIYCDKQMELNMIAVEIFYCRMICLILMLCCILKLTCCWHSSLADSTETPEEYEL